MLELADQLLHAGMERGLLLLRLRLALFKPLRQTVLIPLLLTGGVAFLQPRLIALFMGLDLNLRQLLLSQMPRRKASPFPRRVPAQG